jgi:hypothetical protein
MVRPQPGADYRSVLEVVGVASWFSGWHSPPALMFREVAPPNQVSTEDGLQAFRRAISRLKSKSHRDHEQCFRLFTRDEWDKFHIGHAELHLSFIVPIVDSV